MSVFCYLQIETANLAHEIETRFFDPLIFFGEDGATQDDPRAPEERAGEDEIATSRILPVLGAFFDSLQKGVLLSKNCLLQMNGLFSDKNPAYKESFKKICYSQIFDNLGSILTNLYIVDLIIQDNTNFESMFAQYNAMFQKVKSNMDQYNVQKRELRRVQKFVEKMYSNILQGNLYQQYLDAVKDSIKADLGDKLFKNKVLQEKYLEYLKQKCDRVAVQLGQPGLVQAPLDYMLLLVNYSIYKKLFGIED